MSLNINEHGSREGVLKHVQDIATDGKIPAGTDKAQIEAVKALVSAEIGQLPTEVNGVRVFVEATVHEGARTLSVNVIPMKLKL